MEVKDRMSTKTELAIEVVVSWAGNPLASECVTEGGLRIGPEAGAWLTLPSELLAHDHDLLVEREDGWELRLPNGAEAVVDGAVVEGDRVALARGVVANISLGAFTFFVRASERVQAPRRPRPALRWARWLAVAAILHGIVLGMFALAPPNAAALNVEALSADTRYVSMSLDGLATPTPPPALATGGDAGSSAPAGEAGGGDAAQPSEAGSPAPRRAHAAHRPTAPSRDQVASIGALGVLRASALSFGDDASPYRAGNEVDGPGGLGLDALLARPAGPGLAAFDAHGPGHGTCDPSRQDCTAGLIGVNGLHTRGGPSGHSVGLSNDRRPPAPPRIRTPQADTLGALSREQVRRTVRRHINEVRYCYSQQLQSRPDLEGRVAVRFVVAPTGAVQSTAIASDTVGSSEVASCVERAVARWTFPAAPGVTGVTYPFVMTAAN